MAFQDATLSTMAGQSQRAAEWAQLDTARLVLAGMVALWHAYYIFLSPLHLDLPFDLFRLMSQLVVGAFFVLSGFVIGRTLRLKRDGILAYLARRVLRIYPPLIACFVLMAVLAFALDRWGIDRSPIDEAAPMVNGFSFESNEGWSLSQHGDTAAGLLPMPTARCGHSRSSFGVISSQGFLPKFVIHELRWNG